MDQDDWLDMHRYPNVDPELAVAPGQLARLRDELHAAPAAHLSDDTWQALLHGGPDPFTSPSPAPDLAAGTASSDPSWNTALSQHPSNAWEPHQWNPDGHHDVGWAPETDAGHHVHDGHSDINGHNA